MDKQTELKQVDASSNRFNINVVDMSLTSNGMKVKDNLYDFSKSYTVCH